MYRILFHVITKLPDDTWVYCGHEYTRNNLKVSISLLTCLLHISITHLITTHTSSFLLDQFALTVEPQNEALMAKWAWCQDKTITVPSTIAQEKMYNPFLRVNEQSLQMFAGKTDPVETLATLRELKDQFRQKSHFLRHYPRHLSSHSPSYPHNLALFGFIILMHLISYLPIHHHVLFPMYSLINNDAETRFIYKSSSNYEAKSTICVIEQSYTPYVKVWHIPVLIKLYNLYRIQVYAVSSWLKFLTKKESGSKVA